MAGKLTFHHTLLHVKNAAVSVPFYVEHFGMRLVTHRKTADAETFFLESAAGRVGTGAEPGTDEAEAYLRSAGHTFLALHHRLGTEKDEAFAYHNGNSAPRGFGHIAFTTDDVYAACATLEAKGVGFQKKPDDGRMKGLAFALDPDGYWIEIIRRPETSSIAGQGYSLNQTMLRVKDADASVAFFRDALGMTLINTVHFEAAKFSLYFLASLPAGVAPPEQGTPEAKAFCNSFAGTVIELTHNHDSDEVYHSGATDPLGFHHVAFLAEDAAAAAAHLAGAGFAAAPPAENGNARFQSPGDGYLVEIVARRDA